MKNKNDAIWIGYLILKYFKAFVLSSEEVKNNCKLFCVCTFDISRVSNIMFVASTFLWFPACYDLGSDFACSVWSNMTAGCVSGTDGYGDRIYNYTVVYCRKTCRLVSPMSVIGEREREISKSITSIGHKILIV